MGCKRRVYRSMVWLYAGAPRTRILRTACTEENELLNANSIKMTEAPFGRSDSEDDIVEDYDDVMTIKSTCLRNRTALEKGLLVIVFLALVVIIGLAVGLTRPRVVPGKVETYCKTPACIQAASSILNAMDPSVDPCDDFYQYACGGWERQSPIPPGYQMWDRFQELSGKNLYVLKNLIETNTMTGEAVGKVKHLYRSCMEESVINRQATLADFRAIIKSVGGWSLDEDDSAGTSWDFSSAIEKIHSYGAWPLFHVKVDIDERRPTEQHVLKFDIGQTVLPSDLFPSIKQNSAKPTPSPSPPPSPSPSTNTSNTSTPSPSPSPTPTPTQKQQPKKTVEEVKKIFLEETVHILMAFGMSKKNATARAEKLLDVEIAIASATPNTLHSHDRMRLYNVKSIKELETNYTLSQLSWLQYLKKLNFVVTESDYVVILHPHYLTIVTHIVGDYLSRKNTTQILRDYMVLSLVRSLKPYFDPNTFEVYEESGAFRPLEKLIIEEEEEMIEHWKRCAFYTNSAMQFATGAIYVSGTAHGENAEKIEDLIVYVKSAFKDYLLRKFWMDKGTRTKASEKIDHIIDKISYPLYILNATFLDTYYKNFGVVGDWFKNIQTWRKFQLQLANNLLTEKPDRKKSWLRPPVTVNAFYSPTRNDIIFPIAMFHLPFYIPNGPKSVNFGAMGSIIGHEITHAFDIQGRQYDRVGRLDEWWDPHTAENFAETTKCMKGQYGQFTRDGYGVNGTFTLDENIADNGGLRAAAFAYHMWVDENKEETPLPGLNLTHNQVFFVSFAQMYCSKYTNYGLLHHLVTDPHSPGFARVNGVLENFKTFSWAFDCPNAAKMNSRIKCEVW
ncbi:endothelin-converting enzyme homolog isoform X5 [Haliotis rufescens]|uniref:endothelin-converting enzyme homolog isoform X5 n=1 Tax=Haliotis rufescens TaxID=6454 RepID=UPI00201ED29E|nr:endothelin-converting enzyme homolog isoform X5 [Haliotis rufescens]